MTRSLGSRGRGTKAADLAETQGEHTNTVGVKVSNKVDQLLGFRLDNALESPVHSTTNARVVDDSTVVGEVHMPLTQLVSEDMAVKKNWCIRYSRGWQIAGYGVCQWGHIQTLKRTSTPHARCTLAKRFTLNAEQFTRNAAHLV